MLSADAEPGDEELAAARGRELRRSGLLLDSQALMDAWEHGQDKRYIPVKFSRGKPVRDALASAEQLGLLRRHIQKELAGMARQLRRGSIAADPYYRSAQENACLSCDYFSACRFDGKTEQWRRRKSLKAPEFWNKIDPGNKKEGGDIRAADD